MGVHVTGTRGASHCQCGGGGGRGGHAATGGRWGPFCEALTRRVTDPDSDLEVPRSHATQAAASGNSGARFSLASPVLACSLLAHSLSLSGKVILSLHPPTTQKQHTKAETGRCPSSPHPSHAIGPLAYPLAVQRWRLGLARLGPRRPPDRTCPGAPGLAGRSSHLHRLGAHGSPPAWAAACGLGDAVAARSHSCRGPGGRAGPARGPESQPEGSCGCEALEETRWRPCAHAAPGCSRVYLCYCQSRWVPQSHSERAFLRTAQDSERAGKERWERLG